MYLFYIHLWFIAFFIFIIMNIYWSFWILRDIQIFSFPFTCIVLEKWDHTDFYLSLRQSQVPVYVLYHTMLLFTMPILSSSWSMFTERPQSSQRKWGKFSRGWWPLMTPCMWVKLWPFKWPMRKNVCDISSQFNSFLIANKLLFNHAFID